MQIFPEIEYVYDIIRNLKVIYRPKLTEGKEMVIEWCPFLYEKLKSYMYWCAFDIKKFPIKYMGVIHKKGNRKQEFKITLKDK